MSLESSPYGALGRRDSDIIESHDWVGHATSLAICSTSRDSICILYGYVQYIVGSWDRGDLLQENFGVFGVVFIREAILLRNLLDVIFDVAILQVLLLKLRCIVPLTVGDFWIRACFIFIALTASAAFV